MTIALIMTVYNRERFVGDAVRSVLVQTDPDFDLLVWDDGSTDGSVARARAAAGDDPRVRIIEGPRQGLPEVLVSSWNARRADAPLVGWLDSDDLLEPQALELTREALRVKPDAGAVYTQHLEIDEAGHVRGVGARTRIPYTPDALLLNFMTFHFRLIRVSAMEAAGGITTDFPVAWDYDLCLRLSEVTRFIHLPVPLYRYRQHRDTISADRRVEQIQASQRAIESALRRRGLDDRLELNVEIIGRFWLTDRQTGRPLHQPGTRPTHG